MWCVAVSRAADVVQTVRRPFLIAAVLGAVASGAASLAMRGQGAPANTTHLPTADAFPAVAAGSVDARQRLLERWTPHAERVYGVSGRQWREAMWPTLRRSTDEQVGRALAEPRFEAALRVLDGALPRATGASSVATASAAAAPVGELAYNVITPCRVLDTRNTASRLPARTSIQVRVTGSDYLAQGGVAHDCGVPAGASAVVVNLTAIMPAGPGFLSAYPSGGEFPGSSSLNYAAGDIRANEVLVRLGEGTLPGLSVYSHDDVDVAIDVVGFFAARPEATMACTRVREFYSLPPGNYGAGFAECPQGMYGERLTQRMGGNCDWTSNSPGQPEPGSLSGTLSAWNWMQCEGENKSSETRTFMVTALCCSVQQ